MYYLVKGESSGIPGAKLKAYESAHVMRHAQAAYDLLPPPRRFPNQADVPPPLVWENGSPVSPTVNMSWVPQAWRERMNAMATIATRLRHTPRHPFGDTPITNVAGFGAVTISRAEIGTMKTVFRFDKEGDGTVQHSSATWIRGGNLRIFSIPVGIYPAGGLPIRHSQIWDAPPMLSLFDELLLGARPEPFIAAALDDDDASMGGQRDMKVFISGADARGKPISSLSVTFTRLQKPVKDNADGHGVVRIPRNALPVATHSNFVRFAAIVKWEEGEREVPLMYQRR
jgi:hypothetical protein